MHRITVADLLSFLDGEHIKYTFEGNEETEIQGFSSLKNYRTGTFTWIKKCENIPEGFDTDIITLVFTSNEVPGCFNNVIKTADSKYAFFSAIEHFFGEREDYSSIGEFTYIGPQVKLGKNVRIGHNCSLDGDITIGDNCIIWNNVSIIHRVSIGHDTEIQSGSVIGHDGFGYTENENHVKTMVKHFGGVSIGNNVLISSNVCIVRGTIDDTVIEDGTKIDNLSHIAHNCHLGANVALAFPCFLGGSTTIKDNGYVAGGIIRNQCTIHENGFVGMGAVVTKDVKENTIVIGNPAKEYHKR